MGPRLHPLYGIGGIQFAISRVPVYTTISNLFSVEVVNEEQKASLLDLRPGGDRIPRIYLYVYIYIYIHTHPYIYIYI